MALQGTGPRLYRLQALLRQYLNTEIDAIDAAALTYSGVAGNEDSFITPTLDSADIQVFRDDREAECITVVIVPTFDISARDLIKQGAGTNQARWHADYGFEIYVRASSSTGAWGENGAWLRADRVAHGITAVLLKYPQINIPAENLDPHVLWTGDISWDRNAQEQDGDTISATFVGRVRLTVKEVVS